MLAKAFKRGHDFDVIKNKIQMKLTIAVLIALNLASEASALSLVPDGNGLKLGLIKKAVGEGDGTDNYRSYLGDVDAHEMRNLIDTDDDGEVSVEEAAALAGAIKSENDGTEGAVDSYIKDQFFQDFNFNNEEGHADCISYDEWLDASERVHNPANRLLFRDMAGADDCIDREEFETGFDLYLSD